MAGKVEPVFVDDILAMPRAILDNAREGDVVICMGAGSIGAVPGKVVELGSGAAGTTPAKDERFTREGRAL